jgi:hypothetical protein
VATPTVVAVGTVGATTGTGGNPTAPGIPAGTTTDDIMVMLVGAGDNITVTLPVGWTKFVEQNNGTTNRMTLAWKRAGSSEAAPTVTHTGGDSCVSRIVSIRGVPNTQSNPIAVLGTPSANASSLTVTASTITPAGTTDLVVWAGLATIAGNTSNSNTYAVVGGTDPTFTERIDSVIGSGLNEAAIGLDTGPTVSGAATGSRTSTLGVAAAVNTGVMFTLNDAGGTAAPTTFSTANLPLLRMIVQGGLQRAQALALMFPRVAPVVVPVSATGTATDTVTSRRRSTATVSLVRGCSDSVTFAETPSRTAQSFSRPLPVDSVTFSETPVGQRGLTRPVSDAVSFSESPSRLAQGFSRPLPTDSVTFTEARARVVSATRAPTDTVTFAETPVGQRGLTRLVTDSVTFAESLVRGALARVRAITDSVTFAESLARVLSVSKALTDSVTFSESPAGQRGLTRLITDAVTFAESLARTPLEHGPSRTA